MDTLSYKTLSANKETAQKEWIQVDASGLSLGRLASGIAKLARGKHKTNFTPHADCGDYVIVVNADKVELTGNKWTEKVYLRHTGFPGGQRSLTAQQVYDKDPTRLIQKAVKGMLPKNKLGAQILSNVYVFTGEDHPHQAQKAKSIDIKAYL
ncbi:MAG TPA: 50S ribosomal protein L13 [Moheibacter sp.]|nr:50S ribosomal protein L13 [Moheibacter sp.]